MKVIYYRDELIISLKDMARMQRLWGVHQPYNWFSEHEWYPDYNTGLLSTVDILSVIQCEPGLNKRNQILTDRIKTGLTPSKAYGSDYVERNLLFKLIQDAVDTLDNMNLDDKNYRKPSYEDLYRIYGLPPRSKIFTEMDEQEQLIGQIPKPEKPYDFKLYYPPGNDPHSSYKTYGLYPMESLKHLQSKFNRSGSMGLSRQHSWIGKVYYTALGEPYWQIYVYDYADRDWALQNVLHYLHIMT